MALNHIPVVLRNLLRVQQSEGREIVIVHEDDGEQEQGLRIFIDVESGRLEFDGWFDQWAYWSGGPEIPDPEVFITGLRAAIRHAEKLKRHGHE